MASIGLALGKWLILLGIIVDRRDGVLRMAGDLLELGVLVAVVGGRHRAAPSSVGQGRCRGVQRVCGEQCPGDTGVGVYERKRNKKKAPPGQTLFSNILFFQPELRISNFFPGGSPEEYRIFPLRILVQYSRLVYSNEHGLSPIVLLQ